MEIDFERFCRGCIYAHFKNKNKNWDCCTAYIDENGSLEPMPDGKGGCINYTSGTRARKDLKLGREQEERWERPRTWGKEKK